MNKNVLITGSSKGIGLSIEYKFASLGYNIILNSRNIDNTLSKDIETKYNVKAAVVMVKLGIDQSEALALLKKHKGYLSKIIE